MQRTRREVLGTLAAAAGVGYPAGAGRLVGAAKLSAQRNGGVTKFVRYRRGNSVSHGILDGDTVREVRGNIFETYKETGAKHKLADVKLLYPCEASKVLAVGLNYKSHLGDRKPPEKPELFWKPITSLQHPDEPIVIPSGAKNVHYEGELVIVIGKKAKDVSVAGANNVIFGVTCGNDVSERDWQKADLQWWRAKGADTFAPAGPVIVRGMDYTKSILQTRLNGNVVQRQAISDLLFDCPTIVSFASKFTTLMPGDLIYTGTPQTTKRMNAGDVVEVEIEGIGTLRNKVTG